MLSSAFCTEPTYDGLLRLGLAAAHENAPVSSLPPGLTEALGRLVTVKHGRLLPRGHGLLLARDPRSFSSGRDIHASSTVEGELRVMERGKTWRMDVDAVEEKIEEARSAAHARGDRTYTVYEHWVAIRTYLEAPERGRFENSGGE